MSKHYIIPTKYQYIPYHLLIQYAAPSNSKNKVYRVDVIIRINKDRVTIIRLLFYHNSYVTVNIVISLYPKPVNNTYIINNNLFHYNVIYRTIITKGCHITDKSVK